MSAAAIVGLCPISGGPPLRIRSAGAKTKRSARSIPAITLDATLADMYRSAGTKDAQKHIAQVMCPINSAVQLSTHVPRNAKYLYQDSAFNGPIREDGSNGFDADFMRELVIKYFALITQRDAFVSGNTAVVFCNIGGSEDEKAHDRLEAEKTFSVLQEKQRPNIIFCSGPETLPVKEQRIDLIACKYVHDGLEGYDNIIAPETHWFVNTKAALAHSGLPTPRCDIIEVDGCGGEAYLCCAICRNEAHNHIIPLKCTGPRGKWFAEQGSKIFQALSEHPLPFVFKNQQSYDGAGTYMIRTETDREKLFRDLQGGHLRRLLSSVTPANEHLQPATILLSDLVQDPIVSYGISFFVRGGDKEPIFLAVTEQILEQGKTWIGATIECSCQEKLKGRFRKLVTDDIALWLSTHNYVGPVGADVLETAPPGRDSRTNNVTGGLIDDVSNFRVVDINARTSGPLCLPLLRTHFTSRGLDSACRFLSDYGRGGKCSSRNSRGVSKLEESAY
jgi:hypothetical protein